MIFKRTAAFFLAIASAILLLHSIIPHSHYHENEVSFHSNDHHGDGKSKEFHHHHHSCAPDTDHNDEASDLTNLLSLIIHQSDEITFVHGHNFSNAISKQQVAIVFLISEHFYLSEFISPILLHHVPSDFPESISFHPCTNALRGPPSIGV